MVPGHARFIFRVEADPWDLEGMGSVTYLTMTGRPEQKDEIVQRMRDKRGDCTLVRIEIEEIR
jgi:hypothetical protein